MSTRDLCLGAAIAIIGHAYAPEIIQVLQWPTTYSSANILVLNSPQS